MYSFISERMSEVSIGLYMHVYENCVDLCLPASLDNVGFESIFTGDCRCSRNYIIILAVH